LIATSRQPPLRSSRTYDQLPPQADPGVGAVDYHRAYTGIEYRRTRDGQFFLGMVCTTSTRRGRYRTAL
jgi:hypothetical protein